MDDFSRHGHVVYREMRACYFKAVNVDSALLTTTIHIQRTINNFPQQRVIPSSNFTFISIQNDV
jgi:hypothetical protein